MSGPNDNSFNKYIQQNQEGDKKTNQQTQSGPGWTVEQHRKDMQRYTNDYRMNEAINAGWRPDKHQNSYQQTQDSSLSNNDLSKMSTEKSPQTIDQVFRTTAANLSITEQYNLQMQKDNSSSSRDDFYMNIEHTQDMYQIYEDTIQGQQESWQQYDILSSSGDNSNITIEQQQVIYQTNKDIIQGREQYQQSFIQQQDILSSSGEASKDVKDIQKAADEILYIINNMKLQMQSRNKDMTMLEKIVQARLEQSNGTNSEIYATEQFQEGYKNLMKSVESLHNTRKNFVDEQGIEYIPIDKGALKNHNSIRDGDTLINISDLYILKGNQTNLNPKNGVSGEIYLTNEKTGDSVKLPPLKWLHKLGWNKQVQDIIGGAKPNQVLAMVQYGQSFKGWDVKIIK